MSGAVEPFQAFFERQFGTDLQRRTYLKHWHVSYRSEYLKKPPRLALLFAEFISSILYEPVSFKVTQDYFSFFGRGASAFFVYYKWLEQKEDRDFLVYTCFAHCETYFKTIKVYENNAFLLESFVFDSDPRICNVIWRRELVRDFVWMIFSKKKEQWLVKELIVAMQMVIVDKGKKDIFLSALHDGLQGMTNLHHVLCWGLDHNHLHPEEEEDLLRK